MFEVNAANCVICRSKLTGPLKVRLGNAVLVQCSECGSWLYFPRSTAEQQSAIHDNAAYFRHAYFENRRINRTALTQRCDQIFTRIARGIRVELLRGERLLDVGCDTGIFLETAAERMGVVPIGLDVSHYAVEEAKKHGLEVYQSTLENAPDGLSNFRVITAIDLIEHVSDPRQFLCELYSRLAPGGIAYLETPNLRSIIYSVGRLYSHILNGKTNAMLDRLFPAQHIQYFSEKGLSQLSQECGLEVVELSCRRLPRQDIGTSPLMKLGITALQFCDVLRNDSQILLCILLRKPQA